MADIQSYKCPCCGASLAFDGSAQSLHCSSCGNDFETETLRQLAEGERAAEGASKFDWEHYTPRSYDDNGGIDLSSYSCSSCGAEITGDSTLGATVCPYCGNATIVRSQFEGTLRPDYLIPFKVDKKKAMKLFEDSCLQAPFLPDEFKDKRKIEEMAGIYVPFWTFDCDCGASISYNAKRISVWSDRSYNYEKIDFYKLIREGSIGFANIPVDASTKIDNSYTESVEPYNYNEAVEFNTAYLAGYLADKYDVSAESSIDRANQRVKNSTENAFKRTTAHFQSVTPEHSRVSFSDGKIRYSLLPVWMLNVKYMDKMYKYIINGQTGKVSGNYPVSAKKRNMYFVRIFIILLVIAFTCAYVYLKMI